MTAASTALFECQMVDPEATEPTTSAMVERALDSATVAAAEAQRRWRIYLEALEQNKTVAERYVELEEAARQARYAWAIYHCAQADAAAQRAA